MKFKKKIFMPIMAGIFLLPMISTTLVSCGSNVITNDDKIIKLTSQEIFNKNITIDEVTSLVKNSMKTLVTYINNFKYIINPNYKNVEYSFNVLNTIVKLIFKYSNNISKTVEITNILSKPFESIVPKGMINDYSDIVNIPDKEKELVSVTPYQNIEANKKQYIKLVEGRFKQTMSIDGSLKKDLMKLIKDKLSIYSSPENKTELEQFANIDIETSDINNLKFKVWYGIKNNYLNPIVINDFISNKDILLQPQDTLDWVITSDNANIKEIVTKDADNKHFISYNFSKLLFQSQQNNYAPSSIIKENESLYNSSYSINTILTNISTLDSYNDKNNEFNQIISTLKTEDVNTEIKSQMDFYIKTVKESSISVSLIIKNLSLNPLLKDFFMGTANDIVNFLDLLPIDKNITIIVGNLLKNNPLNLLLKSIIKPVIDLLYSMHIPGLNNFLDQYKDFVINLDEKTIIELLNILKQEDIKNIIIDLLNSSFTDITKEDIDTILLLLEKISNNTNTFDLLKSIIEILPLMSKLVPNVKIISDISNVINLFINNKPIEEIGILDILTNTIALKELLSLLQKQGIIIKPQILKIINSMIINNVDFTIENLQEFFVSLDEPDIGGWINNNINIMSSGFDNTILKSNNLNLNISYKFNVNKIIKIRTKPIKKLFSTIKLNDLLLNDIAIVGGIKIFDYLPKETLDIGVDDNVTLLFKEVDKEITPLVRNGKLEWRFLSNKVISPHVPVFKKSLTSNFGFSGIVLNKIVNDYLDNDYTISSPFVSDSNIFNEPINNFSPHLYNEDELLFINQEIAASPESKAIIRELLKIDKSTINIKNTFATFDFQNVKFVELMNSIVTFKNPKNKDIKINYSFDTMPPLLTSDRDLSITAYFSYPVLNVSDYSYVDSEGNTVTPLPYFVTSYTFVF